MKITMPLVTLLSGAAVGVAVLIASTLSTPAAPSVRNQAAAAPAPTSTATVALPSASSAAVVTLPSPASSAVVVTLPSPASSAPAAAPTTAPASAPAVTPTAPASSSYLGWPANADYAGEADNGGPWISISVRGRQAIAYVRTGYGAVRLNGPAAAGVLYLTGQDDGRLDADYNAARAVGYVIANGIRYTFWAPAVHGTAASSQSAA